MAEVIELAFQRCATCAAAPDAVCIDCGLLRCPQHAAAGKRGGIRHCSACGGEVAELATAPVDVVLDAYFRGAPAAARTAAIIG